MWACGIDVLWENLSSSSSRFVVDILFSSSWGFLFMLRGFWSLLLLFEEFRDTSRLRASCCGITIGLGVDGMLLQLSSSPAKRENLDSKRLYRKTYISVQKIFLANFWHTGLKLHKPRGHSTRSKYKNSFKIISRKFSGKYYNNEMNVCTYVNKCLRYVCIKWCTVSVKWNGIKVNLGIESVHSMGLYKVNYVSAR